MRKTFYKVFILLLIIALGQCSDKHHGQKTNWPCFKGDNLRTSAASDPGPGKAPEIAWLCNLQMKITSSPVIYDYCLYCGADSGLIAINIKNDETLWFFKTDGKVFSTPAADRNSIFFGSWDKNFYALDRLTGNRLWSFSDTGAFSSSPLIDGDLVYVGNYGGQVYAFNKHDGKTAWSYKANHWVVSSPAVLGEKLFIVIFVLLK